MIILNCVVVGDWSVFPMLLEEWKTVGLLKDEIRAKKPDTIKVEADKLQLFLARKANGTWLASNDLFQMRQGEIDNVESDYKGKKLEDVTAEISDIFSTIPGRSIHVLVVVPGMRRIGVNTAYARTIREYETTADRLQDSEQVEFLSNLIADVGSGAGGEEEEDPTRFIVLENSSGTGKTQMAFNLKARGECDVFYVVCGKCDELEQKVYKAYGTRSETFRACVEDDVRTLQRGETGSQVGDIIGIQGCEELTLYGFIWAALTRSDVVNTTVRRQQVKDELERRKVNRAKPFVFFLDEFPRAGKINTLMQDTEQHLRENKLRTMRNVFRSFGLPVVISSTNGTARNLLMTSNQSRGSEPYDWCEVVPSFPDVVVTDAVPRDIPELLMKIILTSRPLFVKLAFAHVRKTSYKGSLCRYLNDMAGVLAVQISERKRRTVEFEMGQLCLFFCTSYVELDDKVNLIDGHLARLVEQYAFKLQLNAQGKLSCNNQPWQCRAVMPSPTEDLLLHLTMTGGVSFRPLGKPLYEVVANIPFPLYYDNNDQRSNNGMRLEALTGAAVVLASHAGGFGGVRFETFLGHLLFELGVRGSRYDIEIAGWGDLVVPFLAPPNTSWPDWLEETSVNFDNLIRTQNGDQIDFRMKSNRISGECKDYSSPLTLDVVKSILKRVPERSNVHLVVTNTLQGQYFTEKGSWNAFIDAQHLEKVNFYRISKESTLQGIRGMPHHQSSSEATKVVLFIELKPKPINTKSCSCGEVVDGWMAQCENESCRYKWFHYSCVGLSDGGESKDGWYCDACATPRPLAAQSSDERMEP